MVGSDELIIVGEYKDLKLGSKFDLSGADESEMSKVLGSVSDSIELAAFRFSEVDVAKIEAYAKAGGEGFAAVVAFLEKHPQSEIKAELEKAVPKKELMPAAEACFLNLLMKSAKVSFRMGDSIAVPSLKPEAEKADDQIVFIGRYKGWMAIKKLTVEKVEDWEVSAILSGINNTIVNKAFDFSGVEKNDALVDRIAGGKRKSFGTLVAALQQLKPELSGDRLKDAYVICKVFEACGYKPYACLEMLVKAHPEVKPKKPKGRQPKG